MAAHPSVCAHVGGPSVSANHRAVAGWNCGSMSCKKISRKDESTGNCTCGSEIGASRFGAYTCCPELHEWAETAQTEALSWPLQLGTIVALLRAAGEDNAHDYYEGTSRGRDGCGRRHSSVCVGLARIRGADARD